MGLFKRATEPADDTARNYLASAPPGSRADGLAFACVLATSGLGVAAASRSGALATRDSLADVEDLAKRILHQDDDIAAAVARKMVVYVSQLETYSRAATMEEWIREFLAVNGVREGDTRPIEVVVSGSDPDGTGRIWADVFWITLRAVTRGKADAPAEWELYSSLYTDPERHGDNYSVIAWGALAFARLLNSDRLDRNFPLFSDSHRIVPVLSAPAGIRIR